MVKGEASDNLSVRIKTIYPLYEGEIKFKGECF